MSPGAEAAETGTAKVFISSVAGCPPGRAWVAVASWTAVVNAPFVCAWVRAASAASTAGSPSVPNQFSRSG